MSFIRYFVGLSPDHDDNEFNEDEDNDDDDDYDDKHRNIVTTYDNHLAIPRHEKERLRKDSRTPKKKKTHLFLVDLRR